MSEQQPPAPPDRPHLLTLALATVAAVLVVGLAVAVPLGVAQLRATR